MLILGFATFLGPLLIRPHFFTFFSWVLYRQLDAVGTHSGYDLPNPLNLIPFYGGTCFVESMVSQRLKEPQLTTTTTKVSFGTTVHVSFSWICCLERSKKLDKNCVLYWGHQLLQKILSILSFFVLEGLEFASSVQFKMESFEVEAKKSFFLLPSTFFSQTVSSVRVGLKERPLRDIEDEQESKQEGEEQREGLKCTKCSVKFQDQEELRQHCKENWHKFNLKLLIRGALPLSAEQFANLLSVGDIAEDDNSSDSDSNEDSENEDEGKEERLLDNLSFKLQEQRNFKDETPGGNSPKVVFTAEGGLVIAIWKRVLLGQDPFDYMEYVQQFRELSKRRIWTILMCVGGHFGGAIFDGEKCVKHKTFHRYTVRKKQGGSQSSRDNKSATSQPKSAGVISCSLVVLTTAQRSSNSETQ